MVDAKSTRDYRSSEASRCLGIVSHGLVEAHLEQKSRTEDIGTS